MACYTYRCECGEYLEVVKSMKDPDPEIHDHNGCCGRLTRDYSGINFNADQGKSDPKSPMYWKKGKSTEQISRVIAGESAPF